MGLFDAIGKLIGGLSSSTVGLITSSIAAPFTAWQTRKKETAAAKHQLQLSELEFKRTLTLSRDSHNSAWELESLKVKERSPMQWISFLVLGTPFIVAWYDPQMVETYFTIGLAVIPEFYIKMFVSIIGCVWGVANLKNAGKGISTSIMQSRSVKHTQALEIIKAQAVNQVIEATPVISQPLEEETHFPADKDYLLQKEQSLEDEEEELPDEEYYEDDDD